MLLETSLPVFSNIVFNFKSDFRAGLRAHFVDAVGHALSHFKTNQPNTACFVCDKPAPLCGECKCAYLHKACLATCPVCDLAYDRIYTMTEAGPDVEDMTFPKSVKKGRARSLNQFYKNLSRKQIQHYFPSILYLVANQRRASDQDSHSAQARDALCLRILNELGRHGLTDHLEQLMSLWLSGAQDSENNYHPKLLTSCQRDVIYQVLLSTAVEYSFKAMLTFIDDPNASIRNATLKVVQKVLQSMADGDHH